MGLPYKVVGGVRFYERREVRDLLAYLRVLVNPDDTVSLRRIMNVPRRGIGDRTEERASRHSPSRERISFSAGAAAQRRGLRHRDSFGVRGQRLRGAARRVAADGGHVTAVRGDGGRAHEERLPRRARSQHRSRKTSRGSRTCASLSPSRVSSKRRTSGGTLADFLGQVALVADADQIPVDGDDTAASSPDDPAHREGS